MNVGNVVKIDDCNDVFIIEAINGKAGIEDVSIQLVGLESDKRELKVEGRDINSISNELIEKNMYFNSRDRCPLCKSSASFSKKIFKVKQLFWDIDVVQCKTCNLAYKDPLASPSLLSQIYTQNYVHHESRADKMHDSDAHSSRLGRLGSVRGRHLDYGCGSGDFVQACLNAGLDSYGADPYLSPKSCLLPVGNRLFKIDATDPNLLSVVGKFDAISIWAVVEHLLDFQDTIAGLVRILNPGGTIIFNSPNANSLIAKYSGCAWRMATLIEHVQFCTPKALRYLADSHGLKIVKYRISGVPYPMGRVKNVLDQGLGNLQLFDFCKYNANSEENTLPHWRSRAIPYIITKLNNYFGRGIVSKMLRQLIHVFRLGDHIEVTLKLRK